MSENDKTTSVSDGFFANGYKRSSVTVQLYKCAGFVIDRSSDFISYIREQKGQNKLGSKIKVNPVDLSNINNDKYESTVGRPWVLKDFLYRLIGRSPKPH